MNQVQGDAKCLRKVCFRRREGNSPPHGAAEWFLYDRITMAVGDA